MKELASAASLGKLVMKRRFLLRSEDIARACGCEFDHAESRAFDMPPFHDGDIPNHFGIPADMLRTVNGVCLSAAESLDAR